MDKMVNGLPPRQHKRKSVLQREDQAACGIRKLRVVIQEKVKGAGMFTQGRETSGRQGYIFRYVKSCHMGGELDLL